MVIVSALPFPDVFPDIGHHILCLVISGVKLPEHKLFPDSVVRPERFILSPFIVADDRIGGI